MSALCYLQMNDMIAQNEDCKYYYLSIYNSQRWKPNIGRYNTMMTYVNIIGTLLNVEGRMVSDTKEDVSPATRELIPIITGDRVRLDHPN